MRDRAQGILRHFTEQLIADAQIAAISSERLTETVLALVEKSQALGDIDTAARLLEHFGPQLGRESHLERLDACYGTVLACERLPGVRRVNLAERRVQILTSLGRRIEAEAVLAAAWSHAETPHLRARLYNRLGYLLAGYSEYAAARQAYQAALAEAQSAGDQRQLSVIYNNLGEMAFTGESYDEALSFFTQASDVARTSQESFLHGLIEGGMAMTLDALARYDEANDHHNAARRGYQEAGDTFGLTRINLNQAYNSGMRGDFVSSRELASQALSQARSFGNSDQLAMAHQHLGEAYLAAGDYELAWESLAQALDLRLVIGKPVYIEATVLMLQRLVKALLNVSAPTAHAGLLLRCQHGLEVARSALAQTSNPLPSQPPPPPLPLPLP